MTGFDYTAAVGFESLAAVVPSATLLTSADELRRHAGDWSSLSIMREIAGALEPPAVVLQPVSAEDVALALRWAGDNHMAVIAAGGRSGVSGGVVTHGGEMVVDMRSLHRVLDLDETSGVVRVEAGCLGLELEEWLQARGFTLGHFPQSAALSTVGGWIAARSAGQLSSGYGAVEDFTIALTVALPDGTLATSRPVPRTAAGPQIFELFLGSEGTLGIVTEAWLRVRRAPATRRTASLTFATFSAGLEGARAMAQARALPDAVRIYDEADNAMAFRALDPRPQGVVGILVAEGDETMVEATLNRAVQLSGGSLARQDLATFWWEHRNDAVHTYRQVLAGELLGPAVAVDTIEVAALWSRVEATYQTVREALSPGAMAVGCHCSHVYETGCALYFTVLLQGEERAAQLEAAWGRAMDATLQSGGTITHHHGVGQLKSRWLGAELGGFAPYLTRVQAAFDPARIMNPRTLRTT